MSGQLVDSLGSFWDGGRSASKPAWRWPICLRTRLTVADLPTLRRRVVVAQRPPSARREKRWPLCHRGRPPNGGGSAIIQTNT